MTSRTDFLKDYIDNLKKQNLYTELPIFSSEAKNRVVFKGKEVIMLSSNNYLGFANQPRLRKAAIGAINKWGFGTGAVRQIAGTMDIHMELEELLAKYKQTEAALIFVAGIAANRGTIQALMTPDDAIISDELNHGSIIDGVRLTKSERKIFPHMDMDGLEKVLKETQDKKKRLIVTDGVFSMDGDIAPLKEICELAEKYDAFVMVDDAHGDGVLGKDGRGSVNHCGAHGKVDIEMGTMSKAFGCLGGYIAGRKELKDYLIQVARSFIFTTAHPPAIIAAITEAIKMVQDEPQHLKNLWENTTYFKKELGSLGFDTGHSETPITPIMVGESANALKLSEEMLKEGVFAKPIVYPLVAKDKSRIRTIVNAHHTRQDLDDALAAFEKVGKKMKLI
ncbi:glycine C-acetyltransferase [Candidatus Aenigmatarchaeota archaeon]